MKALYRIAGATILLMLTMSCARFEKKPKNEDQMVLAAVTRQLCTRSNSSDFYFLPSKTVVVDASFVPDDLGDSERQSLLIRNRLPKSVPPVPLCQGLRLINASEIDGELAISDKEGAPERWAALFKKYDGLKGVIRLSLPGYTSRGDVAVVQVATSCGWLCGGGTFWLIKKVSDRWEVDTNNWVPGWQS